MSSDLSTPLLLAAPAQPLLLPATCATSPARRAARRKANVPIEIPPKPANWARMTARERAMWFEAICHGIETTEDKRWNALCESLAKKWPYSLTAEQRRVTTSKFNIRGLATIAYGR